MDKSRAQPGTFLREGVWIVAGQAAAVAGTVVGVRVLTQLLEPSTYGELALAMTLATLVGQTLFGPVSNGAARFFSMAHEAGELAGYAHAVRGLTAASLALVAVLGGAVSLGLLGTGHASWLPLVLAALAFAGLNGCNAVANSVQNAARQRAVVALHQGLDSWLRPFAAVGLIWLTSASSSSALAGYFVAALCVLVSQLSFLHGIVPRVVGDGHRAWSRQIWGYSWPFSCWGVFTWAQMSSDRWALGLFGTPEAVGYFAVLYQVGFVPIQLATNLGTQLAAPILFELAGDNQDRERSARATRLGWKMTGLTLLMTAIAVVATAFVHAPLFGLFASQQYAAVSHYLPVMLLSGGLFAASQVVALILMVQMRTRSMTAMKIGTALLGIVAAFWGAAWYGIQGVVLASVVVTCTQLAWASWVLLRSRAEGSDSRADPTEGPLQRKPPKG